jgi:glucose-1-phosphate cytidylyltransferase
MKVIILAGGFGTRISEETDNKPKPMIKIGGKPILWHIMKHYSKFGHNDFIICLGYKGYVIKEYFANYSLHNSDITFDLKTGERYIHNDRSEDWNVTLVDTGDNSMTGGRLKRVENYLKNDDTFLITYGDGISDIDINRSIEEHKKNGKICSVTAVYPPGRFGSLQLNDASHVTKFVEKPSGDGGMINGGYFVAEKEIFNYIPGDGTVFEEDPLKNLALDSQLAAFKHSGFWQPMDTLRDKILLENLWNTGKAPWTVI